MKSRMAQNSLGHSGPERVTIRAPKASAFGPRKGQHSVYLHINMGTHRNPHIYIYRNMFSIT